MINFLIALALFIIALVSAGLAFAARAEGDHRLLLFATVGTVIFASLAALLAVIAVWGV